MTTFHRSERNFHSPIHPTILSLFPYHSFIRFRYAIKHISWKGESKTSRQRQINLNDLSDVCVCNHDILLQQVE